MFPILHSFYGSNFEAKNLIVSVSMVSNYGLVVVSIAQQLLPAGIVSSNNAYCPLNSKNTVLNENSNLIFSFSGRVTR